MLGFLIGRVHVKGVGLGTVVGTLLAGLAIGILTKPVVPDLLIGADVKQTLSAHVPIADAVTYVMGDVGVIVFLLAAAPMFLRANLRSEAVKLEDAMSGSAPNAALRSAVQRFGFRAYRVDRPDFAGATVGDLEEALAADHAYVERMRRGGRIIDGVQPDTLIARGDVLAIGARQPAFLTTQARVGGEVLDQALLAFPLREEALVVTSKRFAGRTIDSLTQREGRGLFLSSITRGEQDLPILPATVIESGDVAHIVGSTANIERAVRAAGFVDPDPGRFALPFLAAGIAVGTLLGLLQVNLGTLPVGIGTSCAILLVGLVTGWARSRYPLFGGIPETATRLLQDVGLTVFIAVVGLSAGPHAVEVLRDRGTAFFFTIAGAGVIVTFLPQLVGFWFGARVLRMPVPILLGALIDAAPRLDAPPRLRKTGQPVTSRSMARTAAPRVRDDVLASLASIGIVRPSDLIVRQLRELVSNGTLKPGDRLPAERELAAQFRVGRSHVRDALRRLEFYGVLRTHPQSGTVVAERGAEALTGVIRNVLEFDGQDIAALLETRVVLETETARLAAIRASADDRRLVARAQDAFRARANAGDPALHEDLAFHLAIATASRNPVLASLVHLVAPDVMRHHGENKTCDKLRLVEVVAEHQAICDAIAARDPEKAATAMTNHARMAREQYRRAPKARVVPVSTADSPQVDLAKRRQHR